jgi:hypothetical protein
MAATREGELPSGPGRKIPKIVQLDNIDYSDHAAYATSVERQAASRKGWKHRAAWSTSRGHYE